MMELSFHQLPRLVPLSTLHQHLGQVLTLLWCRDESRGSQAECDGHKPVGSLNNFVFPSSLRGSSSSPVVSENEEATVAIWRCLMVPAFHKHHVLPCNLHVSPASPGNVFTSNCEYFWGLRNGSNDFGDLKLCRTVSNVKPCYANHVNELSHHISSPPSTARSVLREIPSRITETGPWITFERKHPLTWEAIPLPHMWRELQEGEDKWTDTQIQKKGNKVDKKMERMETDVLKLGKRGLRGYVCQ